MKRLLQLLDASASVLFDVVRGNWMKLAAVYLPFNVLIAYCHSQTLLRFADGSDLPLASFRTEWRLANFYDAVVGLVALVIVTRAAWRLTGRPTDANRLGGTGLGAWGRAFAAETLLAMTFGGSCLVGIIVAGISRGVCPLIGMIVLGLAVVFAAVMMLRWMFAVCLCSLFGRGPVQALGDSFAMTRGRSGECLSVFALSICVDLTFTLIPALFYGCDAFGWFHPFATESPSLRYLSVAAFAVVGTLIDILQLYSAVVLTLYIRRRTEGDGFLSAAKPARAGVLAVLGFLLVIGFYVPLTWRNCGSDGDFEARVFRPENMMATPVDRSEIAEYVVLGFLNVESLAGEIRQEKPILVDLFGRERMMWMELPFCSHCMNDCVFSYDSSCERHEYDTYAFKPVLLGRGDWVRMARHLSKLRHTDVQRPMTLEEKDRISAFVESKLRKKAEAGGAGK